jgi:hypothetical protein
MRQDSDKNVAVKQRGSQKGHLNDPRLSVCPVNQWGKHRWARAIKDNVSKAQYIHLLRCRYCAKYLCVEFKRVVMPSGAVMVTERVSEVSAAPEVTLGSRSECPTCGHVKQADNTQHPQSGFETRTLAVGEAPAQQQDDQGKQVTRQ